MTIAPTFYTLRAQVEAAADAAALGMTSATFQPDVARLVYAIQAHESAARNDGTARMMLQNWIEALRGNYAPMSAMRVWLEGPSVDGLTVDRLTVLHPVKFVIGKSVYQGEIEVYCDKDGENADLGEFVFSALWSAIKGKPANYTEQAETAQAAFIAKHGSSGIRDMARKTAVAYAKACASLVSEHVAA